MSSDIFIVLKNTDFTEGRGPMLYYRAYATFEQAETYVLSQSGIFGSPQKRQSGFANDGSIHYNGFTIKPDSLLTGPTIGEILNECTPEELVDHLKLAIDVGNTVNAASITKIMQAKLMEMKPAELVKTIAQTTSRSGIE